MMVSRYNKDKKRTPSHMSEGMTDCLKEMFGLIEGVNLLFGQWQGSSSVLSRTKTTDGNLNPNTVRSARENIESATLECNLTQYFEDDESMFRLINALTRVEQLYPDGQGVRWEEMRAIDMGLFDFLQDFLAATIEAGDTDPDNLIWGKG